MSDGIRAEIRFDRLDACPVARSTKNGATVTSVSRGVTPDEDGQVLEEFTVLNDGDPDAVESAVDDAERVFDYEDRSVYRFERERGGDCVCDRIERHDCTVQDVTAERGALTVTLYASDVESLRTVMSDLGTDDTSVTMHRLTRSGEGTDADPAFVDRAELTDRQREVLRTAYQEGYFEYPKAANAGEIADSLGIARSTFVEHLSTAQSKILDELVDE